MRSQSSPVIDDASLANTNFVKLWGGRSASLVGSAVAGMTLPTVAILVCRATPLQLGLLQALQTLAAPLFGLLAGAIIDRGPRRRVLLVSELLRALALASLAAAMLRHQATLWHLFAVAATLGVLATVSDIALRSYLPDLVNRPWLNEGNAKLEMSSSAAQALGNGSAGMLLQNLGGAGELAIGATSIAGSVFGLLGINAGSKHTPPTNTPPPRPPIASAALLFDELKQGFTFILRHPGLRAISLGTGVFNLGTSMVYVLFLLFVYRQLKVSPATLGLVMAAGNAGMLGAFAAPRLARRIGDACTLHWSTLVSGCALALPVAALFLPPVAVLFIGQASFTAALSIFNIMSTSLRQAYAPSELQGRVNATASCLTCATMSLGSVAGGFVAQHIGTPATIVIGASIATAAAFSLRPTREREALSAAT